MVDVRPLLFINALTLMLLVTAGFASIRDEIPLSPLDTTSAEPKPQPVDLADKEPGNTEKSATAASANEEPETLATTIRHTEPKAKPFTIASASERPEMLAMAEPASAMATQTDTRKPEPVEVKTPPEPTTAKLILRSNVIGDTVTINGREYGATRLDLELDPGRYEVTISKEGYKPWNQTVALDAGHDRTLVGKLEAYTRVNYRDGRWIGGIKTGDGTYVDGDGLRYEGHFVDGEFHGKGTAWYPDGSRYKGDWKKGLRDGEGVWRDADDTRYIGQFMAGQFNGQGTLTRANGDILTGQWQDGRLNGHGSLTTADGMLYVGGFRDNTFHGQGTLTYPDGRHYEGEFSNGEFHGGGQETFADGKKYKGQYIEGRFHGKGLLLNPNGSSLEATFRHGEPYGQVRLTTAAGEVFTARTSEPGVCYREKSYRATQCPDLEGW